MAENALLQKRPPEEGVDLFQRALKFYGGLNERYGIGMIYQNLGNLKFMRGRPAEGFQALHETERVFEQLGDQHMVVAGLSWESLWAIRYSTFEHALETRLDLEENP